MASTACFLHHHAAISSPAAGRTPTSRYQAVNAKTNLVVCKAQKQEQIGHDENGSISRRLALTVLIGAAAVGSKVNPADAAYGEAGNTSPFQCLITRFPANANRIFTTTCKCESNLHYHWQWMIAEAHQSKDLTRNLDCL